MDTIGLTKELISINSVTGSESNICNFISNYLEKQGISVEKVHAGENRYNIIAKIGKGMRKLVLCTHFDTVPPHILPSEKDGKLYGRGSCDAKCHIATALSTLVALSKKKLGGELIFVGVIGEEVGGKDGAKKVMQELKLKADAAIVLEPMNLRLAIAQPGVIWANLEMIGKEMHITQAGNEPNVVEEMAKIVVKVKEEFAKKFSKESIVGKAKFNFTVFHGGETPNVLPGKCVARIDVRLTPNETRQGIYDFIDKCISDSKAKVRPKIEETSYRPPFETSRESAIVKTFQKVCPSIELFGYNACTDADNFNSAGIPVVMFGCGDMKVAHSKDEHVTISDIKKEEEILKQVCEEFLR